MAETPFEILKTSLIYAMSLGSKELFHSNVWAWLLEADPVFLRAFTGELFDPTQISRIEREEGHRDITIWLRSGKAVVIENKLKSIPTKAQLQQYEDGLGDKFAYGILTGLAPSDIVEEGNIIILDGREPWHFVSYSDIAKGFDGCLEKSCALGIIDQKKVISGYVDSVVALEKVVAQRMPNQSLEPVWSKELDGLGVQDLINKLNGSSFLTYFQTHCKDLGLVFEGGFEAWQSFNDKKSTLDFRFSNFTEKTKDDYFLLGIQIEGDEYRRVAEMPKKKLEKMWEEKSPEMTDAEKVFEIFKDAWFDPNFKGGKRGKPKEITWDAKDGPHRTKLLRPFAKYEKEYCFIYQYFDLDQEKNGFDYETLFRRIVGDLEVAKKVFGQMKSEDPGTSALMLLPETK
jgi:hypothetical protein